MAVNIKIQTSSGERLDYTTPESLNIKFNRVGDDYTNPKKRYGEFSYNFSLPKTKRNEKILQFPSAGGNNRKFKVNPVSVSVFNNDALVLSGNLELESIKEDTYECRFYSELTQLVDSLEDVNLQDITGFDPIVDWDYETTQAAHINANYLSSDETEYQFPQIFYSSFFTPWAAYEGLTDHFGYAFRAEGDRAMQNYYYLINRTQNGDYCERYFHEYPLCFYLKSVMEKTLEHVGWTLSGSFWEQDAIKKIIMLYSGENDIYDAAFYTSGGTDYLDINKFLPKYKATNFISDVINTFNLFLFVDLKNKVLSFETYDTVFGSRVGAHDITNKIEKSTIIRKRIENYDPSVMFEDPENVMVSGDNYIIGENSTNALTCSYITSADGLFSPSVNHIGASDSEITVKFSAPVVKRMFLRNVDNYSGSISNANDSVVFLPNMGKQTPQDNDGKKWNGSVSDTKVYNDEEWINLKQGKPMLMFYYGISDSDFNQQTGKGDSSDYFYVDFDNTKQKLGIASPFAWKSYRDNINTELGVADGDNPASIYASNLQSIYMMLGSAYGYDPGFSLIFGDSHGMSDTLYTKFYANRFNRYENSEVLSAQIRMNDIDWTIMQFNQPLLYNKEYYSLMSIKNYDVVKGTANIEIIKQL